MAVCASFDEFLPLLVSALEKASEGRSAALLSLLRRRVGFSLTAEQTASIVDKIRGLPKNPPIAFIIALESSFGMDGRVLAAVGRQLTLEFKRSSGLLTLGPEALGSKAGLSDWIRHSMGNVQRSSVEHVRAVFISLLSLAERDYFPELLLSFLRSTLPISGGKKASEGVAIERQLVRTVGKLVQGKTIKTGQIRSMMAIVSAIEDALEIERASRKKAENQLTESRDLTRELDERIRSLADGTRQREQRIQELEVEIDGLHQAVKLGEERAIELDNHWRVVVTQEVAGERHRLRRQLDHELQEAILAINRENPNTEMAAQRLGRALKILQEAKMP